MKKEKKGEKKEEKKKKMKKRKHVEKTGGEREKGWKKEANMEK